jgi:AraC-like DNA-binding protein
MVVQDLLNKLGYHDAVVLLGEVELKERIPSSKEKKTIDEALKQLGFELIDSRKTRMIEQVKKRVLDYIQSTMDNGSRSENLSTFINRSMHYDYSYLSDEFSSIEGTTIENYFLRQRIEKVKELIVYDQLSLSQIALELGFSSVHHLSAQFKKLTGLTPTHFRKIGAEKRRPLDNV